MTAAPGRQAPPVRIARHAAVCGNRNCPHLIYAGTLITKPPGRAWQHADCERPWQRQRKDRPA